MNAQMPQKNAASSARERRSSTSPVGSGDVPSSTSAKPAAKFSSILGTPVDTKFIDKSRASQWLATLLQKESPDNEVFIGQIVLNHISAHRMPCPKVLQQSIQDVGLLPGDGPQRITKKLWGHLLDQQAYSLESAKRNSSAARTESRISPPRRVSPTYEHERGRDHVRDRDRDRGRERERDRDDWGREQKRARIDEDISRGGMPANPASHGSRGGARVIPPEQYSNSSTRYSIYHDPRPTQPLPNIGYSRSHFA